MNISCGSSNSQTFTVNNANNVTGIIGYTWDLGSANNGWLLTNGSNAPQIINTTLNNLTLIPNCSNNHNNINVSILANGSNKSSLPSIISTNTTRPPVTINGPTSLCTPFASTNYSLTNLPCGSSVVWSTVPSGIVNLSSTTGGSTNLSYFSANSNPVRLIANITNSTCANEYVILDIYAGGKQKNTGQYTSFYIANTAFNTYTNFGITPPAIPIKLTMDASSTFSNFTNINGGSTVSWTLANGNSSTIITYPGMLINGNVSSVNGCGQTISNFFQMDLRGYSTRSAPKNILNYSIEPNPASTTIGIKVANIDAKNTSNFTIIEIYDKLGSLRKTTRFANGQKVFNLDISSLPKDTYLLKITNGINSETQKLVVVH